MKKIAKLLIPLTFMNCTAVHQHTTKPTEKLHVMNKKFYNYNELLDDLDHFSKSTFFIDGKNVFGNGMYDIHRKDLDNDGDIDLILKNKFVKINLYNNIKGE